MRFLVLVIVLFSLACRGEPRGTPPNIVFVLMDDLRADALGCFGNDGIRTPNLDRMASEGARLDAFYVAGPICCPSRASFLTGLYPHQVGFLNNQNAELQPPYRTIATVLGDAGYVTGFIGKAHLGGDPRKWGFHETPIWYPGPWPMKVDPLLMVGDRERTVRGHVSEIFAEAAVFWIERHKDERFFLWLATTAPHGPYLHHPDHPYDQDSITPPPLWPKDEPLRDIDWAGYYSTISKLDQELGRVFDSLRALDLLDNTFVLIVSDNGHMQGSHGYPLKGLWYEEAARVPALARWPERISANSRVTAPISSVDLFPTLADIAGVPRSEEMEGMSMLPALTGKTPERRIIYSEARPLSPATTQFGHWQMVYEAPLKYVVTEDRTEFLFDLSSDPHEKRNLAGRDGQDQILERMRTLRRQWASNAAPTVVR